MNENHTSIFDKISSFDISKMYPKILLLSLPRVFSSEFKPSIKLLFKSNFKWRKRNYPNTKLILEDAKENIIVK